MDILEEGDHWVIAGNYRPVRGSGLGYGPKRFASRVVYVYDCWDGNRWQGQRAAAMRFPSWDAAEQYLEHHRALLEQLL